MIFLLTPLLVTVAVSFGNSAVFTLPPPEWSLRWYERLSNTRGLWPSILTSVQIAGLSTVISLILGTLCAIAIVRGQFPGREAITTFLVSPLMLPGLVVGIAMLQGFRLVGLREAWTSLLIAHVVITMPYVVRTVVALGPAFLTSGMFAFLASMDNYPVSIFFTDAWTKTLPIQMLQYVEERPDPTIAAISAGLILLAAIVMIIGDRLVGLRRLADF